MVKERGIDVAVFPGSFDPLTNGHMDIITRSLKIFDRIVVAVLENPKKERLFSLDERVALIKKVFEKQGDRVRVESFSGLLVEYAKKINTRVIIRGLRAISDYDYEAQIALMNRNLSDEIETFFLMSREENSYISSSLVKEVALLGGTITNFVSPIVEDALKEKLRVKGLKR